MFLERIFPLLLLILLGYGYVVTPAPLLVYELPQIFEKPAFTLPPALVVPDDELERADWHVPSLVVPYAPLEPKDAFGQPQVDEEPSPCEVLLYEIIAHCADFLEVENIDELQATDEACASLLDDLENLCPAASDVCVCAILDEEHIFDADVYVLEEAILPDAEGEDWTPEQPSCVHANTPLSTFSSSPATTTQQLRCALTEPDPQNKLQLWHRSDLSCARL
jgi:hypothetical protein